MGVIKINSIVAISPSDKVVGLGIVIHDHEGRIMASYAQNLSIALSPQTIEAAAILRGLDLAVEVGLYPAIVESDALTVVNLINYKSSPLTEIGLVILDIIHLLDSFSFVYFCHVSRVANTVAHSLAKVTLPLNFEFVWLEKCPPPCVELLFLVDKPSLM
ncbi:hypothetical protein Ddye_007935 [Dipteronia dyeriana]|uniref:RNase H type-1 domain-containing protein n=1 Tax=Dipteronia dyeriana TaxID=168575 RepID=A0AAD9XL69_9ROSI|nr:hypothetical protein Ddye_007935 [Dipteronia dyeriana]